jgi:hypothetical protein
VAAAVFGQGTLAAHTWWAEQRQALMHKGAAPVLAALAALAERSDLSEETRATMRRNREEYFADNRQRMNYPAFLARQLPIGSGAIESACKRLVSQRAKGAGRRWTAPGAQTIANLRAVYHCADGRWQTLWASRPLTRLRLLPIPTAASAPETQAQPPTPVHPDAVALSVPKTTPRPSATHIVAAGKPWAKGPGYWRRSASNAQPNRSQHHKYEALPSDFERHSRFLGQA